MTFNTKLQEFTDRVVVVDDGYKPIDPLLFNGEDAAFFNHQADRTVWSSLKSTHFPSCENPSDLVDNADAVLQAWNLYDSAPEAYSIFKPLFDTLISARNSKLSRLTPFVEYLRGVVGLTVITHPDINSAQEDIQQGNLVFLDFYLKDGNAEAMLEAIEPFNKLFANNPAAGPRFVFLMSSHLPGSIDLDRFRTITKIKSAFFKPIGKDLLEQNWFEKEMLYRIKLYPEMIKLTCFLDTFSSSISSVANLLQNDIDSLELHDLTLLNTIRLDNEQEKLGHYLTWLFSEALAAKIRESTSLIEASRTIDSIQKLPFIGLLEPKPLLFDLYSEIAFSYPDEIKILESARFGDVYTLISSADTENKAEEGDAHSSTKLVVDDEPKDVTPSEPANNDISIENAQNSPEPSASSGPTSIQMEICPEDGKVLDQDSISLEDESNTIICIHKSLQNEKLLLVISPACDLIRCTNKYEVLCVRGYIVKVTPRLSDLLEQQPMFGENRQLMRRNIEGKIFYMLVDWKPDQITTIPISELNDSSFYVKRARLNEIFCHEIKENALRQLGRVGLPVDPAFKTALSATVKIQHNQAPKLFVAPSTFFSGIRLAGNKNNPSRVILSLDFRDWIEREFESLKDSNGCLPDKAKELIDALNELEYALNSKNNGVIPKNNGVIPKPWGKLQYYEQCPSTLSAHYEIAVYPWIPSET